MRRGIDTVMRSHSTADAHIRRLLALCRQEQLSLAQSAYVLATVQHESKMGLWLLDHESGWANEGRHHLGNINPGDGPRFRGRGYIRITGRRQYAEWQHHLGLPLIAQPELVAEPDVAATIAVRGMKIGQFTGHRLIDYINQGEVDYVGARRIVNGQDRAVLVARYAKDFEAALHNESESGPPEPDVVHLQRHLKMIGWPLVADGILGTFTKRALSSFQAGYTFEDLPRTGEPDPTTTGALARCAAGGGYASPHFRFAEFRTGGSHRLSLNNQVIAVRRELVLALERYRQLAGEPVRIASGYRSVGYNLKIGAAPNTQHLFGAAVDLWSPRLPTASVVELAAFTAIGTRREAAYHLEVTADGSTKQPEVWSLDH